MGRALGVSLVLHGVVFALAYVGVPAVRPDIPVVETPLIVDVVTVAEETNVPPPAPEPEPEPEAKPPPPPPPAAEAPPPPPQPEPPPEPEPEVALPEPAPPPEPEPEPEAKPEPPPPPKAEPAPRPPAKLAEARPKRKPKPPDALALAERALKDIRDKPPAPKAADETPPAQPFEAQIAEALKSRSSARHDPTRPLTISEIDLVRRQIARCWNLPAGAKEADDLVIEVHVDMRVDGTPRRAEIEDQARMRADPFFRAAAESALRAVLNPRCHPFKLPPDKYDRWKTMTLVFNPREMFGT